MSILSQLIDQKVITKKQAADLEKEAALSEKRIEEVLLLKKLVREKALFDMKAKELNMPVKRVDLDTIPLNVLELIPEDSVKYYRMVPLSLKEGNLEVGMVYPDDVQAQEALKFLARQGNFSYNIFLIEPSTFAKLVKQYRSLKKEVGKALDELAGEIKITKKGVEKKEIEEKRLVGKAPITKVVSVILKNAVEQKASDIHIEPAKDEVRVRFRMLGKLSISLTLPYSVHASIVTRIKILSNMKIDETRIPQDGRFSTTVNGKEIDFRVSTLPTPFGEKVVIRVLDPSTGLQTFEDLGLDGDNLVKVKQALKKPFGLILVTGPTGSGKSTTLYTILKFLNKEETNIISLEDPIEYHLKGINQSQMRPQIGYDFAQALRYVLRQDPDIIMVGEVRDEESASLMINAALTGHLVLTTLHTNNAIGIVTRLIDMGIKKYLIPPTFNMSISQRLVRKLCDKCKQPVKLNKEIENAVEKELKESPVSFQKQIADFRKSEEGLVTFKPKGCKECGGNGYSGRIALFEIFSASKELEQIILQDPSGVNLIKEAKRQGMITLKQDGIIKALNGVTTIEEVITVSGD